MSTLAPTVLLTALLMALPVGRAGQEAEASSDVASKSETAKSETADEAVRAAMQEAPRRSKIGRIRGLQTVSEVRFASSPDDAYRLVASFGIPDRARVVLSNQNGSFERFQLGSRLFGRDSSTGKAAASFVLTGPGLQETLLDMELRRSLYLWPDAPQFTGAGRTYTSKVGDFAILMATVDESTGLPTKIQSFDKDGGAGAEFLEIQWNKADGASRAVPASMKFAAGGQTIWTETIQSMNTEWRFADTWFLPPDRLTAVLGSKVGNQMRVRALEGAWIQRVPVAELNSLENRDRPGAPLALAAVVRSASTHWSVVRKSAADTPLAPYVSVVLSADGIPEAVEYESGGLSESKGPDSAEWTWREPRNIWAHPLATPKGQGPILGVEEAEKSLALTHSKESAEGKSEPRPKRRLRFRIGEVLLNGSSQAIGMELALTVDVSNALSEDPNPKSTTPKKRYR